MRTLDQTFSVGPYSGKRLRFCTLIANVFYLGEKVSVQSRVSSRAILWSFLSSMMIKIATIILGLGGYLLELNSLESQDTLIVYLLCLNVFQN